MSDCKGPDWYEESERDKMNMLEFCYYGNLEEVAKYLNGRVRINEADEDGVTALQIACAKGYRNLAEFLIRQGADVNNANHCGMTPFLHACREGHVEIVKLLWNNRADIFRSTGLGVSALTLACAGQHFEVIQLLNYFQLPVNPTQALVAPTPFMAACFTRDISIIGFLYNTCKANARFKIESLAITAETFVIKCGLQYALNNIQDSNNAPSKQSRESTNLQKRKNEDLRRAIQENDITTVSRLLKYPALAEPLPDGLTPLMYAAVMQKHAIAEQILRTEPRMIDAQENLIGMTALMFSIISGDNRMIMLLLNANAKVELSLTTKVHFNAVDLLHYLPDFKQEILLTIFKRFLNISEIEDRNFNRKVGRFQQVKGNTLSSLSSSSTSSTDLSTSSTMGMLLRMAAQSFGLTEQKSSLPRKETEHFNSLLTTAYIDWSIPLPFVLAEEILRGDKKPTRISARANEPDNNITLARNIVLHCINHGDLLKPFPVGFPIYGKEESFRENRLPYTPSIVVLGSLYDSTDSLANTQFLCTAQRIDYIVSNKHLKSSVSSCPGYIETPHLIPTANSLPKNRSTIELSEANYKSAIITHTRYSQEKVRNAPSRPNSETHLAGNFLYEYQQVFHHQKQPSTTQSLNAEFLEPFSLNNNISYPNSQASTPSGSGNATPILSRSEIPIKNVQTLNEIQPTVSTSKSANSSPSAYANVNPSESFRASKYTKRLQFNSNSPRSNRPKQKLDVRRLIHQALENLNIDSYYDAFTREEIDEYQFLSLKSNEIHEVLRRHFTDDKNIEEIATKFSNVITQLNNMMKFRAIS